MIYINKEIELAARKAVTSKRGVPVEINNNVDRPRLTGRSGGWFTRGGTPVRYPGAYSKVGWSNLVYERSTLTVEIPKSWVEEYAAKNFCKVVFAEKVLYVKKAHLRYAEKVLSKYEKHIFLAPNDKKDKLYGAAVYLIPTAFVEVPDVEIPKYNKLKLLLLGQTPVRASEFLGCKLNSDDVNEWIESEFDYPIAFLRLKINSLCKLNTKNINSSQVLYWLKSVAGDPLRFAALVKQRAVVGPHGENLTYTYVSKLDELEPKDLTNGLKTSVHVAFENAAKRVSEEKIKQLKTNNRKLAADPVWWPGDTDQYKILRSASELAEEGRRLKHCVAQYAGYVRRKESVIVSLGTSTVEFDYKTKEILQHHGFQNSDPSYKDKEMLKELIGLIRTEKAV